MNGHDIHCPAADSVQNRPLRDQSLLKIMKRKPRKVVLRTHFITKIKNLNHAFLSAKFLPNSGVAQLPR